MSSRGMPQVKDVVLLYPRWWLMAAWWPEKGDSVVAAHGVEKVDVAAWIIGEILAAARDTVAA
ncbi:hypothetical protein LR48_Vigan511s010200 [Vigna angularis]|uniref:Uncharacterized protein n=1 Tax=Phaseolus angularis TaxID=3914 RepID=A0A0L9TDN9_PHAAN|nr:hypothetical protein LR48_Vigan511s010200 [Vigna angularis]